VLPFQDALQLTRAISRFLQVRRICVTPPDLPLELTSGAARQLILLSEELPHSIPKGRVLDVPRADLRRSSPSDVPRDHTQDLARHTTGDDRGGAARASGRGRDGNVHGEIVLLSSPVVALKTATLGLTQEAVVARQRIAVLTPRVVAATQIADGERWKVPIDVNEVDGVGAAGRGRRSRRERTATA
jgi:hypothetical protein